MKVYIDDILIVARTKEQHLEVLDQVLTKLESAGFKTNREKCQFLVREVDFLGYKLGQGTISIHPDRIKVLIDASIPKSATDIKGLSGGLVMVRRFEPKIAEGMVLLNPLSNGKKFAWDESHSKALSSL